MVRKVAVSGGFDPLHVGHLGLFKAARQHGDHLTVIVNSDEWIARKHQALMPQADRIALIASLREVDAVYCDLSPDGDVSHSLARVYPQVFVVGLDHQRTHELPEHRICRDLGIEIACVDSGARDISSTAMLEKFKPRWFNPPVTVSVALTRGDGDMREVFIAVRPDGTLNLPGGFLEANESLEDCVRRELYEETGFGVHDLRYLKSWTDNYPVDSRQIVAVVFTGAPHGVLKLNDEAQRSYWTSIAPSRYGFFAKSDYHAVRLLLPAGDEIAEWRDDVLDWNKIP